MVDRKQQETQCRPVIRVALTFDEPELADVLKGANAKGRLRVCQPDDADVLITRTWPPLESDLPMCPVVLVSSRYVQAPNVIWMSAADAPSRLLYAVEQANKLFEQCGGVSCPVPHGAARTLSSSFYASLARKLSVSRDAMSYTVDNKNYQYESLPEVALFDPADTPHAWCLQGVEFAREAGANIRLNGCSAEVVFLAGGRLVYVSDWQALNDSTTGVDWSLQVAESELMVNAEDSCLTGSDALLWDLALGASAGRWPKTLLIDDPVRLNHWPNLTRLQSPEGAFALFAHWHGQALTLSDLVQASGLECSKVATLMSACWACGLAELESAGAEVASDGHIEASSVRRFWERKT